MDIRNRISPDDVERIVKVIDKEVEQGHYTQGPRVPKFQTNTNLFHYEACQILKSTFIEGVQRYSEGIENVKISQIQGWGYKSNGLSNGEYVDRGPWHDHNPMSLTGVFYLKVLDKECGTEFFNPMALMKHTIQFTKIAPMALNWIIFPGWLKHRSILSNDMEYRYVVAADCILEDIKVDSLKLPT